MNNKYLPLMYIYFGVFVWHKGFWSWCSKATEIIPSRTVNHTNRVEPYKRGLGFVCVRVRTSLVCTNKVMVTSRGRGFCSEHLCPSCHVYPVVVCHTSSSHHLSIWRGDQQGWLVRLVDGHTEPFHKVHLLFFVSARTNKRHYHLCCCSASSTFDKAGCVLLFVLAETKKRSRSPYIPWGRYVP